MELVSALNPHINGFLIAMQKVAGREHLKVDELIFKPRALFYIKLKGINKHIALGLV